MRRARDGSARLVLALAIAGVTSMAAGGVTVAAPRAPHLEASLEPGRPGGQSPAAAGGAGQALSLDEVLASADTFYPLLLVARRDVEAADGEVLATEGGFDPAWRTRLAAGFGGYTNQRLETLVEQPTPLWGARFFAGYRLGRGDYPVYYGNLLTDRGGELRGGVSVPLWRDGPIDKRRAAIERARLERTERGLVAEQARLETLRSAAYRYWEWVASGRRLEVAERLLAIAQRRQAVVEGRVARGDLPAIEQADNARAVAQRGAQVAAALRGLERAANELSLFLRGDDGAPVVPSASRLPATLPEPASPSDEELARATGEAERRRPEVRRFEAVREQSEVDLRLAQNQRAPAIDVTAQASRDFGDGGLKQFEPAAELGVTLEIPLLAREARGKMRAAEAKIGKAREQRRFALDQVRTDVRDASSALRRGRERLEAARLELELARRLEEAERRSFELGASTLLFLNLREQATAEAAVKEIEALAELNRADAAWQAARAVIGPTGQS